ncbi:MAG: Cytochrome subunit of sulfide dehydrogenase [Pseudomonadota bacterium]|jgi:cytochrome c553
MSLLFKTMATGLFALAALGAQAQVAQVKVWAAACANCHGTNGKAQPGMESLAGKDKDDMSQKLLDFKSGRKPATIMHQLAKGYSDDQLKAIAAYFAAQPK